MTLEGDVTTLEADVAEIAEKLPEIFGEKRVLSTFIFMDRIHEYFGRSMRRDRYRPALTNLRENNIIAYHGSSAVYTQGNDQKP